MNGPIVNWELNIGQVFQAAIIVIGLAIGYGQFAAKLDAQFKAMNAITKQTTRIERYLSSQDPSYWPKVRQYGDDN